MCVLTIELVLWVYFKEVGQYYFRHLCQPEVCLFDFSGEWPKARDHPVKEGLEVSLCGGQTRTRSESREADSTSRKGRTS